METPLNLYKYIPKKITFYFSKIPLLISYILAISGVSLTKVLSLCAVCKWRSGEEQVCPEGVPAGTPDRPRTPGHHLSSVNPFQNLPFFVFLIERSDLWSNFMVFWYSPLPDHPKAFCLIEVLCMFFFIWLLFDSKFRVLIDMSFGIHCCWITQKPCFVEIAYFFFADLVSFDSKFGILILLFA